MREIRVCLFSTHALIRDYHSINRYSDSLIYSPRYSIKRKAILKCLNEEGYLKDKYYSFLIWDISDKGYNLLSSLRYADLRHSYIRKCVEDYLYNDNFNKLLAELLKLKAVNEL